MSSPPRFDLRLLRAAVTVRQEGSVTGAARRLGTSQPALSRLLATLERQLGFALFDRSQRRLLPSPDATGFLDRAAVLLTDASRLGDLAQGLKAGRRLSLRILAVPNIASGVLPPALVHFAVDWPEVEVQAAIRFRPDLLRELEAGEADFGVTVLPVGSSHLRARVYAEAEAVCLVPATHRLARRPALAARDLAGEPLAVLPQGAVLQTWVEDAFARDGLVLRCRFVVDTASMAASLVAAGQCCTVTHPLAAAHLPQGVAVLPFLPRIPLAYALLERAEAGLALYGDSLEAALRLASRSA
jgi:DNA-binding transcriptional LysR family regulator